MLFGLNYFQRNGTLVFHFIDCSSKLESHVSVSHEEICDPITFPTTHLETDKLNSPAAGEFGVTIETKVPTTTRVTVRDVLGSILEPGPSGFTGSIIWSRNREPRMSLEDLGMGNTAVNWFPKSLNTDH